MALRWKKAKRQGMRIRAEVHELRDRADGPVLMHVQQSGRDGWFFYGLGVNSAGQTTITDLEQAKRMAMDHARTILARQREVDAIEARMEAAASE